MIPRCSPWGCQLSGHGEHELQPVRLRPRVGALRRAWLLAVTTVGLWTAAPAPDAAEAAQGRVEARARVLSLESQQAAHAETAAWVGELNGALAAKLDEAFVSGPGADTAEISTGNAAPSSGNAAPFSGTIPLLLGGGPVPGFAAVGWRHPVSARSKRAPGTGSYDASSGVSSNGGVEALIWDRMVDDERVRARMVLEDDRPVLQLEWIAN